MDGGGFRSHLFVTNLGDTVNACGLVLSGGGLHGGRIRAGEGLTVSGSRIGFELAAGASLTLNSAGASAFLSSGRAALECNLKLGYLPHAENTAAAFLDLCVFRLDEARIQGRSARMAGGCRSSRLKTKPSKWTGSPRARYFSA